MAGMCCFFHAAFSPGGTVYGAQLLPQPGGQEGSEPPESWQDVRARLCLKGALRVLDLLNSPKSQPLHPCAAPPSLRSRCGT